MAWYDSNWQFRKPLTIAGSKVVGSGAIADQILYFDPSADADIVAAARVDGFDILFTAADGETKIPHELLPTKQFVTKDGAWSWFARPQVVYHNGTNERLYVCTVGTAGGIDQVVTQFDYSTGTLTTTNVNNVDDDDHINPVILVRSSDSKLLCFYSKGHSVADLGLKISTNAEDATAWGSETALDPDTTSDYTYPCPFELTDESLIYLFYRKGLADNRFITSDDNGATWSSSTAMLTGAGFGSRPYMVFCSNGVDRIDALISEGSPNSGSSPWYKIFHVYYDGSWRQSDGTAIGHGPPFTEAELTVVFDGTSATDAAWIGDITYDSVGSPHCLFVVYPSDTYTNHDLYHGYLSGGSWVTEKVCDEGAGIISGGNTYHGGSCLDPDDEDVAWVSKEESSVYEIQKWRKTAGTWAKESNVTANSSQHHFRPVVALGCPEGKKGRLTFVSKKTYANFDNYLTGISAHPALGSHFRHCYIKSDVDGTTDTDIYVYYGNPDATDQQDRANVWSNYIRVVHTQQPYGSSPGLFQDSSDNGTDIDVPYAQMMTISTTAPANVGEALIFDGTTSTDLELGAPNYAGWTAATHECWAQYDSSGTDEHNLLGHNPDGSTARLCHRLEPTNDTVEIFGGFVGGFKGGTVSTITVTANTWQYHAAGWSAAGGIIGRVDKTEGGVASTTDSAFHASASPTLRFAGSQGSTDWLTGIAAELRASENRLVSKDSTDTQWDNWDQGNTFYTIGAEEELPDTFSATAASTFGGLETSATATFDPPVYSGSAAQTFAGLETTAVADFTSPTYSGSAAQTFGGLETSASAIFATAVYAGASAVTFGGLESSAAGTFTAPVYSGTASQTFGGLETAAAGTHVAPTFSATAAVTFGGLETSAFATFGGLVFTGSAALTYGGLETTAAGDTTPPTFAGNAAITFGGLEATGSAIFGSSLIVGTAALTMPEFSVTGVAEFIYTVPPLVHHVHFHGGTARLHGHVGKVKQSS